MTLFKEQNLTIMKKPLNIGYGVVAYVKIGLFRKRKFVLLQAETPTKLDELIKNTDLKAMAEAVITKK